MEYHRMGLYVGRHRVGTPCGGDTRGEGQQKWTSKGNKFWCVQGKIHNKETMVIGFQNLSMYYEFPDNVSRKELFLAGACNRLHANIARFQRANGKDKEIGFEGNKKPNVTPTPSVKPNLSGSLGNEKSYRGLCYMGFQPKLVGKISEPSIVLVRLKCFMSMIVVMLFLEGLKVFVFSSQSENGFGELKAFTDIGYQSYGRTMGLLEFKSLESMEKFKKCVSVMSWFSQVIKATNEFEVDGRIAWVEVEGVPFKQENQYQRRFLKSLTEYDCIGLELMKSRLGPGIPDEYDSEDDKSWYEEGEVDHGEFIEDVIKLDGLWDSKWKEFSKFGRNSLNTRREKRFVIWNRGNSGTRKNDQLRLKKQLEEIDLDIDRGLGNEELVNSRLAILHQIQKIDNLERRKGLISKGLKLNGR
ncbi:hypothetical protein Tco_1253572 [Tanacetum coccineum]